MSLSRPENNDDALSVRSAAPSYTSTLPPSYESTTGSPPRQERELTSLLTANYNVTTWPSLAGSGHQDRAYANVAERRTRRDRARARADVIAMSATSVLATTQPQAKTTVGVTLEEDGKSWDFLNAQMADWQAREKSWQAFRKRYGEGREKLGARGLKKWWPA